MDRYTQNMMMSSGRYAEERNYWLEKLSGEWVMGAFPPDHLRPPILHHETKSLTCRIEGETYAKLQQVTGGSAIGLYMALLVGVNYLLYRYSSNEDFVIGMPDFKSNDGEESGAARFYALRTVINRDGGGKELLLNVKDAVSEARKNRHISFEMIKESLDVAVGEEFPLFSTVVLLKGLHDERFVDELRADTAFVFALAEDAIEMTISYNALLFNEQTMTQFERHLSHLYEVIFRDLNQPLSEINILPEDEAREILVEFNNTDREYPRDQMLFERFLAQAKKTPSNIAILFEDESLTYQELDEKSNQCARYLMEAGIGTGDLVGVVAKRCPNTIIHFFGIMKAGAAYVPVDPEYPEERRTYILENSQCKLLLQPDDYEAKQMSRFASDAVNPPIDAGRLAYVIYTSGSTGTPKGVAMTHRSALNTVLDCVRIMQVSEADRVLSIASFCFDITVVDVFGTLGTGGTLVLVPNQKDIKKIVEVAIRHQATIWNSVPSALEVALLYLDQDYRNTTIRIFMLSGDFIPVELYGKVKHHFPDAQVINFGGVTEVGIWSLYYPIQQVEPDWTSIPYGMPLSNQQLYVLNKDLQPCPYDVEGELYIGGEGLAVEYYRDEKRTNEAFIQHPFLGRLYKTGDFCMLKREGYIKLHGRKDFQVKIRGFRVDMREIQMTLQQHEGVREVVVTARTPQGGGNKYLAAYCVLEEGVTTRVLRDFLGNKLPHFMVPAFFVRMDSIPLSANGKIDLKALPEPDTFVQAEEVYQAPRNEIEEAMVQVWQEVLGLSKIGVYDNFFALGGDSIKALRVIAKMSHLYPIEIQDMFENQTIAYLAERVEAIQHPDRLIRAESVSKHPSLLQVQEGDGRTPLFMMHPIGGLAFCYADLARELPGQPLYGFQSRGFLDAEEPLASIHEMAAYYIEGIRLVQPAGPYQVGGWSFGGVVAYEVARQLREQGEAIESITLIDSFVPALNEDLLVEGEADIARAFAADLARRLGVEIGGPHIVQDMVDRDEILRYVIEEARALGVLPTTFRLHDLQRYYHVFKSNRVAYRSYKPIQGEEPIVLFRAEEASDRSGHLSNGWHEFARELTIHQVPGDHFTMVQAPHVREIANVLKQRLLRTVR